jgi:hypothetical protein
MIAIAVSAMLMVGSMQLLSHMVVTSAQNRANTMAMLQVQYVGFWVTEDVVQARPDDVTLTDPLNPGASHFPLTIQWTQWNGVEHKVVYSVEGDETWTLYRHEWYTPKGGSEVDNGMTVVGESLDPVGTLCNPLKTQCEWVTDGNVTAVLKLDVSAVGDIYAKDPVTGCYKYEVSRTYEINPRSK